MKEFTNWMIMTIRSVAIAMFLWGLILAILFIVIGLIIGIAQVILGGGWTILKGYTAVIIIMAVLYTLFDTITYDELDESVDVHEDPPESFNIKP